MTENEAIKILQGAIKKPNTQDGYLGQSVTMAIQALEEIQQYKAIGTEDGQLLYQQGLVDGYAKALDEFAERLKYSLANNYRHLLERDTNGFDWITTDAIETHIEEIAEQMKAGGENE